MKIVVKLYIPFHKHTVGATSEKLRWSVGIQLTLYNQNQTVRSLLVTMATSWPSIHHPAVGVKLDEMCAVAHILLRWCYKYVNNIAEGKPVNNGFGKRQTLNPFAFVARCGSILMLFFYNTANTWNSKKLFYRNDVYVVSDDVLGGQVMVVSSPAAIAYPDTTHIAALWAATQYSLAVSCLLRR